MKLIKLNTDFFVIVDDSEITEGDWVLMPGKTIHEMTPSDMIYFLDSESKSTKKITHSSIALYNGCRLITPLSLYIVKELIGEVDVERVVEDILKKEFNLNIFSKGKIAEIGQFVYNQALENNKEKIFTENQVRSLVDSVTEFLSHNEPNEFDSWFEKKLSNYKPKTEWEVEFDENKIIKLKL